VSQKIVPLFTFIATEANLTQCLSVVVCVLHSAAAGRVLVSPVTQLSGGAWSAARSLDNDRSHSEHDFVALLAHSSPLQTQRPLLVYRRSRTRLQQDARECTAIFCSSYRPGARFSENLMMILRKTYEKVLLTKNLG